MTVTYTTRDRRASAPPVSRSHDGTWFVWLSVLVLTVAGIGAGAVVEPWLWMWILAGSIYAACKAMTLGQWCRSCRLKFIRTLLCLFLWPGMDAPAFWVHGIFIVLTIIGFGGLTMLNSEALVGGSTMARSLCAFIAIFWGARLVLQFGVFDPTPYVEGRPILLIGHHGLTIVFAYLTAVYGWVAIAVEGSGVA